MKKWLTIITIWVVFMTGVHFYNWHNQIKFNATVMKKLPKFTKNPPWVSVKDHEASMQNLHDFYGKIIEKQK